MDGEITIGTRLDTDKFDRQISDLEKKIKKEEDKKIIIDAKLGSQQQELDKARQKTDALAEAYQRLKEVQDRLATGQATPKEFTTFQDLQNTYGSLEKLGSEFDKALSKQDTLEQKVAQTKYRYDEINSKVSEYRQKIENVKIEKQVSDVEKLKNSFNSVGSSIQNSIRHVAKLALGIFGIRSAFMFLRRASSDLASYNPQYAANLEYIRYALTQAIAPVLQWIVNLAAKLLGYINAIMQGWFGINLFSRGSAESFQKMKSGASGASKAVKQIKKDLAGFDEINKLTDQSDTGTSAGAGGVGMPSFDLSKMQGDPPKWLQWIIDHKDEILTILASVAAGLLAWKLGFSALTSLGIAVAVYGVIEAVKGLLAFIKNPTWKNFKRFLSGLTIAIAGVATAMIAFNATNPVGWILLAIAAISTLIITITDLIIKLTTNRAKILDVKKAQEELTKAKEKAREATDAYVNAVDRAEKAHKDLIEAERKNKLSGEELYQAVQNGTLDYQNMTEAQREVYKAYLENKSAEEQLKQATEQLSNAKKEETRASWENQLAIANETKNFDEFRDSVVRAYKDGQLSAEEARNLIERAMQDMSDDTRQTFTKDLPNDIADGLNPSRYDNVWRRFRIKWNEFWNSLKTDLTMKINANFSGGGGGRRRRSAAEAVELKVEYSILANCQD